MKITTVSDTADSRYENANAELLALKFDRALSLFSQAYNMAYSVDDADLLCRISLSGIAYKIATGMLDAEKKKAGNFISDNSAEDILKDAKYFATRSGREKMLVAVCSIYDVRLALSRGKKNSKVYESELLAAQKELEKEPFYLAHLYRTLGDVRMVSKDYNGAEEVYVKAAELHTKNRYVGEIGTDWYGAARARSLSGDKDGALSFMEKALQFDRDSENTAAIASDYYASAKILAKSKPTVEEKKKARALSRWAASIYRAGGFEREAKECEDFASSIK